MDAAQHDARLEELATKIADLEHDLNALRDQTRLTADPPQDQVVGPAIPAQHGQHPGFARTRTSRRWLLRAALGTAAATMGVGTLLETQTGMAQANGEEGPTVFISHARTAAVTARNTARGSALVATSNGDALTATSTSTSSSSYGVKGTSSAGIGLSGSGSTGVTGNGSSGYGGAFQGGKAPLYLTPSSTTGAPMLGSHAAGELYVDKNGALFLCSSSGIPGLWEQIAPPVIPFSAVPAPPTAGVALYAQGDGRLYSEDSRGISYVVSADNLPGAARVSDITDSSHVILNVNLAIPGPDIGWLVIDPFSTQCEIAKIATIGGTSVTLAQPLIHAHSPGAAVLWTIAPLYDVALFGATGDGSTDDTTAIQAAITAAGAASGTVYFPSSTYRVISNLFVIGSTDLLGAPGATIELDATLTLHDPGGTTCWINLGIAFYGDGSPGSRWSGRISALRFTITPNGNANVVLACHNCEQYAIEDNYFDLQAHGVMLPAPLSIWAANTAWCPAGYRARGIIRGNRIIAAQDENGTEGIDHADASYLIVEDNYVSGVGDDLIGLHLVDHAIVCNNYCSGVDGAIYMSHCTDFEVDGNYVERAAAPDGTWYSGHLLRCDIELVGTYPPCSGGRIVNNEFVLPAGVNTAQGLSYMMRLEGLRRAVVANNILRCDTTNVVNHAISVEPTEAVPGWIDAEGIEPDDIARPRWLSIHGNRSVGNVDVGMGEGADLAQDMPGPITWRDNDAVEFTVFGMASSFSVSNRVLGGSGDGMAAVSGQLVPDAPILWDGIVTITDTQASAANGGVTRFYPARKGIIFLIKATFATALTAGTVTVHLAKNGVFDSADDLVIDPSTPYGKRTYYYNNGVNNRFIAGDYLEAYAVGASLAPIPLGAIVEMYGMYTDNDFNGS